MEFFKIPLEKTFYFIAGIVPGFVALLIYAIAVPGSFKWFFELGFLGYGTKVVLILFTCFLIGNSMTAFSTSFLGAVGGAIGGLVSRRPFKPAHTYQAGPWRDRAWRIALKKALGADVPNDTLLITEDFLAQRTKMLEQLPEAQQQMAISKLMLDKLSSEIDDGNWKRWYDHYHGVVLSGRPDVIVELNKGLHFNLETAAFYVLISATMVPSLRHWWCLLPASLWAALGIVQNYSEIARYLNQWSTLSDQVKLLSGLPDAAEASNQVPDA